MVRKSRNEDKKKDIPGSGSSILGYILTNSRFWRDNICHFWLLLLFCCCCCCLLSFLLLLLLSVHSKVILDQLWSLTEGTLISASAVPDRWDLHKGQNNPAWTYIVQHVNITACYWRLNILIRGLAEIVTRYRHKVSHWQLHRTGNYTDLR